MLINDEEDHLAKVMLMLEDKNSGTETKSLFLREFDCILYGYPIYKKHKITEIIDHYIYINCIKCIKLTCCFGVAV